MSPDQFLLAIALLFLLDVWTTLRILAAGGEELNPLMRWAMRLFTPAAGLMLVKFGLLAWISRVAGELSAPAQRWILLVYIGVVVWNLYQLHKGRA